MILKDEEAVLDIFLSRIKPYVDEIVIVDAGSKDLTKIIASKHTPFVYDFKWKDDFSLARNFSISKAKCDWILWLDPDEYISKQDLDKIKEFVKDKSHLGYRFIQETIINGKKYVQGICKLFQNHKKISFMYPVHESVMPSIKNLGGKIGSTGIVIKHDSKYNLEKAEYYLKLIEKKDKKYPESSSGKEIRFMREINETIEKAMLFQGIRKS